MLVQDALEFRARAMPSKTALVCDGVRLSYAAVDASAARIAGALRSAGVARGERVAVYLPNCVESVASIYGALKAGGVFVVISRGTKPAKLLHILEDCGASVLIASASALVPDLLDQLPLRLPYLRLVIWCGTPPPPPRSVPACTSYQSIQEELSAKTPPRTSNENGLACLIYTSNSTGLPNGVMATHDNVLFAANSLIGVLGNTPDDIVLSMLPLAYDYGLYQLIMTLQFGGTLVLEDSFAYPAPVFRLIAQERVTGLPGVPTIFAMMLNMDLDAFDLSSLRYLTNTGTSLTVQQLRALRQLIPGAKIFSMYGLAEAGRTLVLPPDQVELRPSSLGLPIPGAEVWIEGKDGQRLGPGEIGEAVIRGRHVTHGFWNAPGMTAARYRLGGQPGERICTSGDLLRADEDGYFYFVARNDDVIRSRGEKVSPREIESVLCRLRGVLDAAVIGVPDPILGEVIKAYVVPSDPTLSEARVISHCRDSLDSRMIPQVIEFRASIPRTSSGKISKRELN